MTTHDTFCRDVENSLLNLLGIPEATTWVVDNWISQRRPPLREHVPYFIFVLTINIFFCFVLPTELLRNVKPSHPVDLAYLYYLPFCTVFTSRDRFHTQVGPLFLDPFQTFVHGDDLKQDLRQLDALYSALPEHMLKGGLIAFASSQPEDTSFLTTQLWDKYLPGRRSIKTQPKPESNPEADKEPIGKLKQRYESSDLAGHDEQDVDKLNYVTIHRNVRLRKGKWRRFHEESEQRMRESGLVR